MLNKIKKLFSKIAKRYLLIVSKKLGDFSTENADVLLKGLINEAKDTQYHIGIIGFGNQGKAIYAGISSLACVSVKIVCDSDTTKLKELSLKNPNILTTANIDEVTKISPELDLIIIATTAPFHLTILNTILNPFKGKILIEKPLDSSLKKAIDTQKLITTEQSKNIYINYSKRHLPDLKNIKNILKSNVLGKVRTIHLTLGNGELAMIASHYFDYLLYLLEEAPIKVQSRLATPKENQRGNMYEDHNGNCILYYPSGISAFFDFSDSHSKKNVQLLVKCDTGYIFFDETKGYILICPDGMSPYIYNSMENGTSAIGIQRVLIDILIPNTPMFKCSFDDGVVVTKLIYACHYSNMLNGQLIDINNDFENYSTIPILKYP